MKSIFKTVVKVITSILALFCCGFFLVFYVFDPDYKEPEPVAPRSFINSGVYKIDANTILTSIDSGEPPIFLPETAESNTSSKIEWEQPEYLKVAAALFKFTWKESWDNEWSINRMVFEKGCEENLAGFDNAIFLFSQPFEYSEKPYYRYRAIEISLWEETVAWGDGNSYPRPFFGINEHDLDNLKVTADDALRVAEEEGGRAKRQSVQNKCTIGLYLDKDWRVVYYPSTLFEIKIDPYTRK